MAEVDIQLNLEEKQVVQALTKLTKKTDQFGTKAKQNFKSAGSAFQVFQGAFAAGIALKGLNLLTNAARSLFNTFITEGIRAAAVQEDAINQLNVALKSSGRFTEEVSKGFQEFASSLQESTKFGDEVILQNAALIQSLGQLDEKGLRGATTAALDLSAALGINLLAASTLVGKAAAGEVGSFSRFGLIIKKGADNAETFANVLEKISTQFGGAAAAQVKTFSGATTQLSNTFGDLQEVTGGLVTQNPAILAAIKQLNKAFLQAQDVIKNNSKEIQLFIKNGIISLLDGINAVIPVISFFAKSFKIAFNAITIVASQLALGVLVPLKLIVDGIQFVINAITGIDFETTFASKISGIVSGLSEQVQADGQDIVNAFSDTTALDTAGKAFDDFSDKLKQSLSEQNAAVQKSANIRDVAADAAVDTEKEKIEGLRLIEQEEMLRQEEQRLLQAAAKDEATQADLDNLKQNLSAQKALRDQAGKQDLEVAKKIATERKKIREKDKKQAEQSLASLFSFEKNTNAGKAANFKSTLGTIATLQSQGNKTLFAIGKAAALSTATIDGIAAVQKALASAPPPFNFALAALVGVASAANIAKIASSKPPGLQAGGIVPGPASDTDNQIIRASGGELVLNRRQQTELFNSINQGTFGQGGGATNITFNDAVLDDESRINNIIDRIGDQLEFRNATLRGLS